VFAVPRSMAMSRENRPKSQFMGLKANAGSSMQFPYLKHYTMSIKSPTSETLALDWGYYKREIYF
jgi:hypothetical protein